MPYASISDLPEAVQKRYSARCQGVFLRVFNSTEGDEASRFAVAHTAATNCADSGKALGDEEDEMPGKASTNDTRTALESALKVRYGAAGSVYVQDFDPAEGWVIFTQYPPDGQAPSTTYRAEFSFGADDSIALEDAPLVAVEQKTSYVPVRAPGTAQMVAMKAAELDEDELEAWLAGKTPRRLLAIPFGGPIPAADGKGRDLDVEFFDEKTDIKPDWFEDRPVDWHHSKDPSGVMNGVLIGKASRLGTLDGQLGEPDEDGWWVDLWMKAGEKRLALVEKLVRRGAQLFGSSYAYPNLVRRGKAGHIDVWPYMLQTLSTSPQNTHSAFHSAKAVLGAFDQAEITVSDRALRQMLTALDDLRDLPAAAANGRLDPARDLPGLPSAKAGRELSGANQSEIEEWIELLESISVRAKGLRDRVRERYAKPTTA